jgi:DNA-binding transcriptional regulator YhcF (GntR family)
VVEEIGMQQKVREEMARDLTRSFLERMRALGLSGEEIGKILKEEENR